MEAPPIHKTPLPQYSFLAIFPYLPAYIYIYIYIYICRTFFNRCTLYYIYIHIFRVSLQLVYGHFVYDTSSTDISSTDISSTMTFLPEIEVGVMKRKLCQ